MSSCAKQENAAFVVMFGVRESLEKYCVGKVRRTRLLCSSGQARRVAPTTCEHMATYPAVNDKSLQQLMVKDVRRRLSVSSNLASWQQHNLRKSTSRRVTTALFDFDYLGNSDCMWVCGDRESFVVDNIHLKSAVYRGLFGQNSQK